MAMVKQLDKRTGITYVYESVSYWDREKKQPRSKRTLIGRLDLLPIPVRNGFIDVSDSAALVQLPDHCHPNRPPANPCYVL